MKKEKGQLGGKMKKYFILLLIVFMTISMTAFAVDSPIKHREASPVAVSYTGSTRDHTTLAFAPSSGNDYFLMAILISASDNNAIEIGASKTSMTNVLSLANVNILASKPILIHAGGYPIWVTKENERFTIQNSIPSSIKVIFYGFEYPE